MANMIIVKMLKTYDKNPSGEICGFPAKKAKELIEAGGAELYNKGVPVSKAARLKAKDGKR